MRLITGPIYSVPDEQGTRMLVWVLRDQLGLTGTKFGCGAGFCGSCTIQLDGQPTRSCLTPTANEIGKEIKTIEDLAENRWRTFLERNYRV